MASLHVDFNISYKKQNINLMSKVIKKVRYLIISSLLRIILTFIFLVYKEKFKCSNWRWKLACKGANQKTFTA
jgi:hypothetical protein